MYVHLLGVFDELCTGMQATEIKKKKNKTSIKFTKSRSFLRAWIRFPLGSYFIIKCVSLSVSVYSPKALYSFIYNSTN